MPVSALVNMAGVDPLVSFMVRSLCNLLIEEGTFLVAVKGQVEEMKTELTRMQSFLIDADRKRGEGDVLVTNWVVEIRELAYDAEEVIATFTLKVATAAASGAARRPPVLYFDFKRPLRFVKKCTTRHVVGTQIQEINKRIGGLTRSLQTYGVQPTVAATKPRITYPTVAEETVVGLVDHIRTVVAHLKDKSHSRIISIWGIGGLGKTTFCKEIHRHIEVKRYFDHIAWVCVSQQCNPDQVWRDVLLQFADKSEEEKKIIRKMTSSELVGRLHSWQMENKCLVVLDDIWKQEDWNSLSPAFPRISDAGSKIIISTRNKVVVSHADMRCFPYNLPLLKKEECLELLEKKVSSDGHGFSVSAEMKNVMEEIVNHCGGLPLAMVLVGGLLAEDKTLDGWEKVHRDLNNCLNKGSDRNGGVWDVLALSYQDLPYHLKACFLYLSLLPEDFRIRAKELVQMWIAEGFVHSPARGEGTKTVLDVGLRYLDELVNRCMVQAKMTRFSNRVRFVRVHDLMHDFCRSKAQEENFSEDVGLEHSVSSTCAASSNKIRRLAVYLRDGQQQAIGGLHGQQQYQHVRSCSIHNWPRGDGVLDGFDEVNSLLKRFKFVKVISMVELPSDASEGELSEDLGNLRHLRYLRIPNAVRLPSSLAGLILLQTLDFRMDSGKSLHIPDVLWKLKELRHLYLPHTLRFSTKLRLDGLSKLETLDNFNTYCSDVGDLSTMTNLRKVYIKCQVKELAKIVEMPMFSKSNSLLRRSTFYFWGPAQTQEEYGLLCQVLAFPRVLKVYLHGPFYEEGLFLNLNEKITRIDLESSGLKEDPMPVLEKMPNLRTLNLLKGSYIGKNMVCLAPKKTISSSSTGGFPQLTSLFLDRLSISEWRVEEGAMPNLSRLLMNTCNGLQEFPDGLGCIATLVDLYISHPSESMKQRLQEGGQDFHKIQHIPFFRVED